MAGGGSTLTGGFKTDAPLPLERAKKVYESLVKSKTGKGYLPSPGIGGSPFVDEAGTVDISSLKDSKAA